MTDAAARRPGWQLDERASAGRENLDVDHVARYDAKEAWDASAEVRLLESLGLDAGSDGPRPGSRHAAVERLDVRALPMDQRRMGRRLPLRALTAIRI